MKYSVGFFYPGKRVNCPDDGKASAQASRDLSNAAEEITTVLKKHGIETEGDYMWPDGSLYLRFESELEKKDLFGYLDKLLKGSGFSVQEVYAK